MVDDGEVAAELAASTSVSGPKTSPRTPECSPSAPIDQVESTRGCVLEGDVDTVVVVESA